MDQRAELTTQLLRARLWILGVGLAMFAVDMFVIYVWWNGRIDPAWRTRLTIYDAVILTYFLALWWLARRWPVRCCVLALVGFWALHGYLAVVDPTTLAQGILIKALFTLALLKGIASARRATQLRRALGDVFD
jgi:hypothetical protein